MEMILLGYKNLDFTNKEGELVKGTQAFVSFAEEGVEGKRADKLFFRDGLELPNLKPGMTIDVVFNRKGKPEQVTVASASQRINLGK